jgi:hypothetical protein
MELHTCGSTNLLKGVVMTYLVREPVKTGSKVSAYVERIVEVTNVARFMEWASKVGAKVVPYTKERR